MSQTGYVTYIDEAGDDGLKRVRPFDAQGATEWFVLAALVVEVDNDQKVQRWLLEGIAKIQSPQRKDIHFTKLDERRRIIICNHLSSLPVRALVVISNKKNMQGYKNSKYAQSRSKNWFYNYIARILLEKVTRYCYQHSMRRFKEPRRLRIEFSTRGGMSYPGTKDYLAKLYLQSRSNTLFNSTDDLSWDVVDIQNIHHFDHCSRAGLQLADVVASAFYQGLPETNGKAGNQTYARILEPKLAKNADDTPWGVGLKFLPYYLRADLTEEQQKMFEVFGAPKKAAGPRPLTPPVADRSPVRG